MSAATRALRSRHTNHALVVEDSRVVVRDYQTLSPAIRAAIEDVLERLGLPATFDADDRGALVVPRVVGEHNMAQLIGRCVRPTKRKLVARDRVHEASLRRRYDEPLDPEDIARQGAALAALIGEHRDQLTAILQAHETRVVADDEIDRTIDLMSSLDENRAYFQRRVGEIATFLPCNQPLYALACFGLVPALMSRRVHVRPPRVMGSFFEAMVSALELGERFGNVSIRRTDRSEFIAERSRVHADTTGQRVPVTDAVIFTGASHNAHEVRKRFHRDVLFIVNGAGHNPLVVTATANIDDAIASAIRVQLYNQGQDCASPSAILVHGSCYERFVHGLRRAASAVGVGPYERDDVTVGPLTRKRHLKRIQSVLVDNAEWLDEHACGVIRTGQGIVEPTIICRPLRHGGNFTEHYAPLFFVQRYERDAELSSYFEDPRYPLHAMYVTVFGRSRYVDGLVGRQLAGRVLHDESTIIRDTDLHAPGVERGTQPYGGYGFGASSLSLGGRSHARPTLPQRDLFEQLVQPTLGEAPVATPIAPEPTCPPRPSLGDLEAKFFDSDIAPVYGAGTTQIEPLIDGADYLGAVHRAMRATRGPGDVIYLLAYQLDPTWNVSADPSGAPLGQLLATKAAAGVEVRVVLNGTPAPLNPWRENRAVARQLRSWRIDSNHTAPLADCVVVDSSGASFTGSHHQKLVIVKSGDGVTAFVSGMDLVRDHWDHAPHASVGGAKSWPDGSPWGWHDVGLRVRGEAVRGIWDNFRARWLDANRSRRMPFRRARAIASPPGECPTLAPRTSAQSAQVLRSAFGWRSGPVRELYLAMKRAIAAAERYIYIEDQFLCDNGAELFGVGLPAALVPIPPEYSLFGDIADRIIERPDLKVVFVGSGKSDPIDFAPGPRNRHLTPSLRRMMARIPPDLRGQVAVWRVENVTVHSKLVLVDDELAAIGSANFRSRSFFGLDDELQIAYVAADGSVARLRAALWGELLNLGPNRQGELDDPERALGHWHPSWAGADHRPAPAMEQRRLALVTA